MASAPLGLKTSGFRAYLVTQLLGAFNDNAFKFAILSLITFETAGDLQAEGRLFLVAQALFAVPFVVFAAWSGALADRYSKTGVMVTAKAGEIVFMALAIAAYATAGLTGLLVVLFFMSTQSTVFGPAKYGFLGERMAERDLSVANGWVSMTTFVAIVLGQVTGGAVFEAFEGRLDQGGMVFVGVAVAGLAVSFGIPKSEAARPGEKVFRNPVPHLMETWAGVAADRTLLYTIGGLFHFSVLAATMQVNLLTYGQTVLELSPAGAATFVATSVIGIALGSMLAGYWSGGHIELGLVPLGAMAMSAGMGVLAFVGGPAGAGGLTGLMNVALPYLCVLLLGTAGGLFYVPLQSMLQHRAPARDKGRFLAFGNFVFFVGVFLSAALIWLPREFGLGPRGQAVVVAIVSVVGTIVSLRVLPLAFARFCAWLAAHTVYRIRVDGAEHLPDQGGALVVANHVSWVDWLVLAATTRRNMRFLVHRTYFHWPVVSWLFRLSGCIPVAAGDSREQLDASLGEAGRQVEQGHIVVVFVEGALTRTGNLLSVRSGYRRVVAGRDVPIVPAHIDGLWQSVFSAAGGRFFWKWPRRFKHPVRVTYGAPLKSDAEAFEVRYAIQRLSTRAWAARHETLRPLHVRLLREGRRRRRRTLHEPDRPSQSVAGLLAESLALRDALRPRLSGLADGGHVALLMDRGLDAARALLAVQYAGRVPVPLDVTMAPESLAEILRSHRIEHVLTTPGYRDRVAGSASAAQVIDVAALAGGLHRSGIARWASRLRWMRTDALVRRAVGDGPHDADAPAAVIFSTGSSGDPKGVVLSHFNVASNVDGLREVLDPLDDDVLLGGLSFAQAYGFTALLWWPLLTGLPVVWHPQPRDGDLVGHAVERHGVTLLMASPRHLELWLEGARSRQMGSVRFVLAVGAALPASLGRAFLERFGVSPVECYSATECGPVIALNTPDVRGIGVFQRGAKPGTVGHPLPGVTVEAVDPVTGELMPHDEVGLLVVHGPGVMTGYLDAPDVTAEVLRDGGYVSGDLGSVDRDGFVTLAGRRAVVAGTGVPLQAVEQAIHDVLDMVPCPVAVLSSADGRRLVVVHEDGCLSPENTISALRERGLPPSWIPRREDFLAVERLPLTSGGLVDNQAVRGRL